jgi:hypothetical protein
MSSSKVEKEDEGLSLISKSMTVDKLKRELTKNKIVYSTGKNKAYYVDLYISNGLHNKALASSPKSTRKTSPQSTRKTSPKSSRKTSPQSSRKTSPQSSTTHLRQTQIYMPMPSSKPTSVLSSIRDDKPIIPNSDTIEIIKRIFSGKDINIENKTKIQISEKGEKDDCALFVIYPDHIYITGLHKCGTTTGNNLLEKFDLLVQQIPNMAYIKLDDESNIKMCGQQIQLYTLKILTTGQSWYNKYGYGSDDIQDEILNNKKIINMPYEKFRDMVYAQRLERNDDKKQLEAEIDRGNRLFPETKKTVQNYFIYVMDDINKNIKEKGCDDEETKEKCRWLSKFILKITISSNLIIYQQIGLIKEQLAGGAKRIKSKKNISKKSKKY